MIWTLNLICSSIISIHGFPAYIPEWNHYPSSGWHPSDWMYNYGAPPPPDHEHDHENDHHNHVNQQQIIIHDSVPTTLTAKESYHDRNGNVIQDMITHITTTGFDYENDTTIPEDGTITVKKIKRSQPMFKNSNSKKKKNNKNNRTKSAKSKNKKSKNGSKSRKSSPSPKQRRKTSSKRKQPYRSRNRFCEFDELCGYQSPIRRKRPYFDYNYYNSLPFRYNRFRYRDRSPFYDTELDNDYYDYVDNFNPRPAKQQSSSESNSDETNESSSTTTETSSTSTEMSTTTTTTTTTSNFTGYGYGPSNGNENVSFTTVVPIISPGNSNYNSGQFDYSPPGSQSQSQPQGNDHYSLVSYSNPNRRVSDHDIFVRSATEQVVAKVKEAVG